MSLNYKDSILSKMKKGTSEDPFISTEESQQVVNSVAVLAFVPDEFEKVTVSGLDVTWIETKGTPTANQYRVDYSLGVVHFDSSRNGENLTFSYKSRGVQYFPHSRVWTKENGGEVGETLKDIIDTGRETIDQLGEFNEKITEAETATANANDKADYAQAKGDYANNQGNFAKEIGENLEHKGEYNDAIVYKQGNIVDYFGNSHMCIQETTAGINPSNSSYWHPIVSHATQNDQLWIATEGQTVFTITNGNYAVGKKHISVWVGGVPQISGEGYTETNSTTITLSEGVPTGTRVYAKWFEGATSIAKNHYNSHYSGGNDEIDITQLRNFEETVVAPLTQNTDEIGYLSDSAGVSISGFYRDFSETDDTGRLQRAMDKVLELSSSGGSLNLDGKEYTFTTLHLRHGVRIKGLSRNVSKLRHIGTGIAIFNPNATAIGRILIEDITIIMNTDTTIAVEFARTYMSSLNRVDITGNGSTGTAVSFDDGVSNSSYYNSCYDVSINGITVVDGINQKTLGIGFKFANSANSNRLINCRANYVIKPVDVPTDYCNHIVITGCAFEQFDVGVRINGDLCIVAFNRFENAGGAANGTGIIIEAGSTGNVIIGNVMLNLTSNVTNNSPTGGNLIFNYSGLAVKYLEHESDGGWKTQMDMRNYGIKNAGHLDFMLRTTAPATLKGRLAYADGVNWIPTDGEGLYLNDGILPRKVVTKRGVPSSATATGKQGEIAFDSNYTYYCVADNTWRRTVLSTW